MTGRKTGASWGRGLLQVSQIIWVSYTTYMAFMVAQMVKNPPTMQETQVRSLGREDPLEKGMATHSSILAWRIPRTEEPSLLQSTGLQRVGHDWVTKRTVSPFILHLLRNLGGKICAQMEFLSPLSSWILLFYSKFNHLVLFKPS